METGVVVVGCAQPNLKKLRVRRVGQEDPRRNSEVAPRIAHGMFAAVSDVKLPAHLVEVLDTMSQEMGVPRDALVSQAVFQFAPG